MEKFTCADLENSTTGMCGEDMDGRLTLLAETHFDKAEEFFNLWTRPDNMDIPRDWNLCIYYKVDQHKEEETGEYVEGAYYAELLILHQRRAELTQIYINLLEDKDATELYKYLEHNWITNVLAWKPID